MKTFYIIGTMIFSTVAITWTILRGNSAPPPVTATISTRTGSELLSLQHQISALSEQLTQANETLLKIAQDTSTQSDKSTGDIYAFSPSKEDRPADEPPPLLSPDERQNVPRRPRLMVINPTPEQQESYEALNTQLDDMGFVSTLNLREFAGLPAVRNLPKPLQMVLVSKAVKQYNQGLISEETFLGTDLLQMNQ